MSRIDWCLFWGSLAVILLLSAGIGLLAGGVTLSPAHVLDKGFRSILELHVARVAMGALAGPKARVRKSSVSASTCCASSTFHIMRVAR